MKDHIETIFTHGPGEMGIDQRGNLYWNGEAVITQQKISLEWWVNLSIIIASLSTVVTAVVSVLQCLSRCADK